MGDMGIDEDQARLGVQWENEVLFDLLPDRRVDDDEHHRKDDQGDPDSLTEIRFRLKPIQKEESSGEVNENHQAIENAAGHLANPRQEEEGATHVKNPGTHRPSAAVAGPKAKTWNRHTEENNRTQDRPEG